MEDDSARWNADIDESHSKKRKATDDTRGMKKGRDEAVLEGGEQIPPSLVDTGEMLKEAHPALSDTMRKAMESNQFHGAVWSETNGKQLEYDMAQWAKMSEKSQTPDDMENFKKLENAIMDNRKRYEEIRNLAIEQLRNEGKLA